MVTKTDTARLNNEYRELIEFTRQNDYIKIAPVDVLPGKAPAKYLVTYNCFGIEGVDENQKPILNNEHLVEIELSGFPKQDPLLRCQTPVWHPNIGYDVPRFIDNLALSDWDVSKPISDIVKTIGEMIRYKRYEANPSTATCKEAAEWVLNYAEPNGLITPEGNFLDDKFPLEAEKTPASSNPGTDESPTDESPPIGDGLAEEAPPTANDPDMEHSGEEHSLSQNPFGKSKLVMLGREVRPEPRPFPYQRSFLWKPERQDYDVPALEFSILVTKDVLDGVMRHVSRNTKRELGGFLLGNRYVCTETGLSYVQIDNYLEAEFSDGNEISMNLQAKTWFHLQEEREGKFRGKDVIGWYHSHPNLGIFLSQNDVIVHENRFQARWTTALVVDPVNKTGGFFCWRENVLHPRTISDFYELRPIDSKITHMPWKGYVCLDGKTGNQVKPRTASILTEEKETTVIGGLGTTDETNGAGATGAGENRLPWYKKYRYFILIGSVAAAILIMGALLTWRFGPFGGEATNSNKASGNTTKAASPGDSPARPQNETPVAGETSQPNYVAAKFVTVRCHSAKVCFAFFSVTAKPTALKVTVDGQVSEKWSFREDVSWILIDVSESNAIALLRANRQATSSINISLVDGSQDLLPDNKTFKIAAKELDLPAPAPAPAPGQPPTDKAQLKIIDNLIKAVKKQVKPKTQSGGRKP